MKKEEVYKLVEDRFRSNHSKQISISNKGLNNVDDAEEAVQDAYVRALTYWDSLKSVEHFDTWFDAIARNCARDKYSDKVRGGMVVEDRGDVSLSPAEAKADLHWVGKQIGQYPEDVQEVLNMFVFGDRSGREISELVDMSHHVIKRHITQFKQVMKEAGLHD